MPVVVVVLAAALLIPSPGMAGPLRVQDAPNDGGGRIEVTWPADSTVATILQRREGGTQQAWQPLVRSRPGIVHYTDGDSAPLAGGHAYEYLLTDATGNPLAGPASATPRASWIDASRLSILGAIVLFLAFILIFRRAAQRGADLYIRRIPGLHAIEEAVGRATEMGKPVLYVPGIDEANNIQTIYSMVILGSVAKMVARYETPLIVPVCRSFVVPMAEEAVRQGYMDAGRPEAFTRGDIRYLSDEQFAFTAAVNGIMLRERPAANLFLGSFFAESLMLAETGLSTGAVQIAGTANIHQLPFFVVSCDYTLIGEEFFATSAYLSREPDLIGTLKGTDWMKGVIILLLLAGALLETFHVTGLTRLLGTE